MRRLMLGRALLGSAVLGWALLAGGAPRATASEAAADVGTLDQVLRGLAERRHGHVAFTEVQRLSMLDQPLRSSGELLYDAPDRLEKRTLEPHAEDLLLENGVLTVERNHRRRSVALRDFPQAAPFIESLRATLAGDRAALERYFSVHLSGNPDDWTLDLIPTEAALGRSVRHILISGGHNRIRKVEIQQSDGDSSTLTIGPDLAP